MESIAVISWIVLSIIAAAIIKRNVRSICATIGISLFASAGIGVLEAGILSALSFFNMAIAICMAAGLFGLLVALPFAPLFLAQSIYVHKDKVISHKEYQKSKEA
ncbi:MAG: hypothetical protein CLLPBCKN_006311 [Chroococcidiopsis cubana SAG 39.79]|uniref:Uncharacterized protein n=1 Tax=Chroococcidiopsis cubana SAG 39.79 TaxID=388085 RepID=A0AB37UAK1_9CYAN|nr:hypothetical protein [Chroococcidiopsis cubana]MDZ4876876.1 hypothetical protein [Chroococcidiopsis cubana SAG 39.79]PSB57977.1 hypothetical protein C7B79_30370 [Chroococcidiopsis cubana CCALA 043]RUT02998.1 hypothetical protein DSM107010_61350 [Chroococcidiopsis cubana SAG 39.79]